jgi:hypothetical protein
MSIYKIVTVLALVNKTNAQWWDTKKSANTDSSAGSKANNNRIKEDGTNTMKNYKNKRSDGPVPEGEGTGE